MHDSYKTLVGFDFDRVGKRRHVVHAPKIDGLARFVDSHALPQPARVVGDARVQVERHAMRELVDQVRLHPVERASARRAGRHHVDGG